MKSRPPLSGRKTVTWIIWGKSGRCRLFLEMLRGEMTLKEIVRHARKKFPRWKGNMEIDCYEN